MINGDVLPAFIYPIDAKIRRKTTHVLRSVMHIINASISSVDAKADESVSHRILKRCNEQENKIG